jgi:hypothetical protein
MACAMSAKATNMSKYETPTPNFVTAFFMNPPYFRRNFEMATK